MSASPITSGQFGVYTRTYARTVNARYQNNTANYVTPKERWNTVMASMPITEKHHQNNRLSNAIREFQRRYPNIHRFNDPLFRICRSIPVPLSHTCIDTTIQRLLDIGWCIDILEGFTSYQAMPVQMYRVAAQDVPASWPDGVDYWAAWDGQHTLIVFWILAVMIFKQDPNEVMIPMVEYDMQNRMECRVTFMNGNSKNGKKIMEPIDLAQQKIYACKLDGVLDPAWKMVEHKHDALAAHDLFLTASKFYDHHEPGAITRPGDVVDEKISVEVVRQFGVYADHVLNHSPRAIDTKELPIILGFLKMSGSLTNPYNDDEVRGLANLCIDLFDANFNEAGPFWAKVEQSYRNWHNNYYSWLDETLRPGIKINKDWAQGGTFMWHQLRKSWKDQDGNAMRMPQLNIQTPFHPDDKDLW